MLQRYSYTFLLLLSILCKLHAQELPATPKTALDAFVQGDYEQALTLYQAVINDYNRDPKINYYYGICLLKTNDDISESIKRLTFASSKGVSKDVLYYLGRAYQLNYEFDEAINCFDQFIKYAKDDDARKENAVLYKQESEEGKAASVKIYYLQVVGKDTTSKDQLLSMYHPVEDAGYILYNKDFFEAGVEPNGILYLTERKDAVFFALADDQADLRNLFKMEKLIDGWSEMTPLEGANSELDEVYPFLQLDGATLFFSSNRPGGLGGYDIYKTTYDPESKTYTDPLNMGIPFNSPMDDYFFVSDEFSNVAWFASNRHTKGDKTMVYQFIWDETVVKNVVYEQKDVKIAASMPVLKDIPENVAQKLPNKTGLHQKEKTALFYFKVNDAITHTDYSDFKNTEALRLFKQGFALQHKKDSLSLLMKGKREKYSNTTVQKERDALVNEILALEKQVYGLDSQISDFYFSARQKEQATVEDLIRKGRYSESDGVPANTNDQSSGLDKILIPAEYSFYTNEEFAIRLERLDAMYKRLFPAASIAKLKQADSLYVWGHILTLEANKMMEAATRPPQKQELIISSPFKQKDAVKETEEAEGMQLTRKSIDLKNTAINLYHKSLDIKYDLYRNKIKGVSIDQPTIDFTFLQERQAEANAYFRQSSEEMADGVTFNPEQFEKAGTLKREAVDIQEEALFLYLKFLDGDASVLSGSSESVDATKADDSEPRAELKPGSEANSKTAIAGSGAALNTGDPSPALEFRIQIGVFRNEPSSKALERIPPVSKQAIPDKDLTKYFAGHFATFEAASSQVNSIQEAGFPGAFVVAFLNGEQISLSEAKALSQ